MGAMRRDPGARIIPSPPTEVEALAERIFVAMVAGSWSSEDAPDPNTKQAHSLAEAFVEERDRRRVEGV
jgi:hypothetical protein